MSHQVIIKVWNRRGVEIVRQFIEAPTRRDAVHEAIELAAEELDVIKESFGTCHITTKCISYR